MNEIINKISKEKGRNLIKLKYTGVQIVKKNKVCFCLVMELEEYEIYYISYFIKISKKNLNKRYNGVNILDKSKIYIKIYAPTNINIITI